MNNLTVIASSENCVSNKFTQTQLDILKNSICKGVSNEEFEIFIMACAKTQLDPFMRQIYAVKRWDSNLQRKAMTIQTGIDGYRLIAERTEKYAPGPEPTYFYDCDGRLISATAYIKKQTKDGTWHTVSASAYIDEYCQTILDKDTGEKRPIGMWSNMPRTMLAKCAEAQALRKAFPAEMSNLYTKEEMLQAESVIETTSDNEPQQEKTKILPLKKSENIVIANNQLEIKPRTISASQAKELKNILDECDINYKNWLRSLLKTLHNVENLTDLPSEIYLEVKDAALNQMQDYHAKQREESETIMREVL